MLISFRVVTTETDHQDHTYLLKGYDEFISKLKTAGSTDQGDHRNQSPGSPRFGYRQDARHWNITKS